jgi:hypothetical protein
LGNIAGDTLNPSKIHYPHAWKLANINWKGGKKFDFCGVAATISALWCTCNDINFEKKNQILPLCRLYSGVILAAVLNVAAA